MRHASSLIQLLRRVFVAALFLVPLAINGSPSCVAAEITADSSITAVTVFTDRAMVTRSASLRLDAGAYNVRIGPLPGGVEPNSITAKGKGKARVTLYGASLDTVELEEAQNEKVKALEEELFQNQEAQQKLRNLKYVLKSERDYLDSIKAASSEQIGKDMITRSPNPEEAALLFAFLDEHYLKVFERDQEADAKLRELAEQQDRIRREIQKLTNGRHRQQSFILVELEAESEGSFDLEVSYRVPGATWEPAYEARVDFDEGAVELISYGLIRQRTDEDWKGVVLTLSTAKPALKGTLPELQPIYLRPFQPVAPDGMMNRAMLLTESMSKTQMAYDMGMPAEAEEQKAVAGLAMAAVSSQGPAVTYTLPKAETILADWEPQKAPIASQHFHAEASYGSTPRLLPYAFLKTKVKNETEQLLLPGPVAVFLDGAFISTASLELIGPGEEFVLYLGVDERVKVERKPLKEHVEVSLLPGLRGKTKTTDYAYLTTVENFTGKPISITVFDLIPVSDRKEIVVDEVRIEPSNVENIEERPGVFKWSFRLAPNNKEELSTAYRVRYPENMLIEGL